MAGNQSDVREPLGTEQCGLKRRAVLHPKPGEVARPGRPQQEVDLKRVDEFRDQGLSWRQIATRLRVGYGTVRRAWQRRAKTEPKILLDAGAEGNPSTAR